jgi:hypothetical protein
MSHRELVDDGNTEPGLHQRAAGVAKRAWMVVSQSSLWRAKEIPS